MRVKRALLIVLSLMILVVLVAGCNQNSSKSTGQRLKEEKAVNIDDDKSTPKSTETPEPMLKPLEGECTTILLMGSMNADFSNENQNDYALTHILITLDPKTRSLRFATIPYNLKVKPSVEGVEEWKQMQFLNAEYNQDVVVKTLEDTFGITIDGWVMMNMHGVISIVDQLKGLKIDIQSLSLNKKGEMLADWIGIVWQAVEQVGKQILSGVQVAGYFSDTYPDEGSITAIEEEMLFRERHPAIIDALLTVLRSGAVKPEDLLTIADETKANFTTSLSQDEWQVLATLAIGCLEGEQSYLHVPTGDLVAEEYSLIMNEDDPAKVKAFVSGE